MTTGEIALGLETHEQRKRLQAKVSAVHKVSKKDEPVFRALGGSHRGHGAGTRTGAGRSSRRVGRWGCGCGILLGISTGAWDGRSQLLSQLGVRNLTRWLDVLGCDDRGGRLGGLDVILAGHAARDPEELEQVVELAMDIAADRDGGAHRLDVGLCTCVARGQRADPDEARTDREYHAGTTNLPSGSP